MEPQEWEPCNYQLADCSMEHAVWIPDVPVLCESESTEMACLEEETFVASASRGRQLVQYAAAAAATPTSECVRSEFRKKAVELCAENDEWSDKMHRYPPSILEVGERYTVPKIVSIGPYHHGREHLKKAEEMKHVAVSSCIEQSEIPVQDMYNKVVAVAHKYRSLYDKDTMAGIDDEKDFWPMMFIDACFLAQFMLRHTDEEKMIHPRLQSYFMSHKDDIYHDILLLENQIPWVVLETLARFTAANPTNFAAGLHKALQNSRMTTPSSAIHYTPYKYNPPHLLGCVRFFIVGTNKIEEYEPEIRAKVRSFSVSAIELAKMGITLTPSKTPKLANMGFKVGLYPQLSLPHILLNNLHASILVNMAAFEIMSNPLPKYEEETAACSYVQLLRMMMHREEDVQELRSKSVLAGGGGLTDKETLKFFTSLQGVTMGSFYYRTIRDVEVYKQENPTSVWVCSRLYKYKKYVAAGMTGITALLGLFAALKKIGL